LGRERQREKARRPWRPETEIEREGGVEGRAQGQGSLKTSSMGEVAIVRASEGEVVSVG
jgi:hypothetical protein